MIMVFLWCLTLLWPNGEIKLTCGDANKHCKEPFVAYMGQNEKITSVLFRTPSIACNKCRNIKFGEFIGWKNTFTTLNKFNLTVAN